MNIQKVISEQKVSLDDMIERLRCFQINTKPTEYNEAGLSQIQSMINYLEIEQGNPQLLKEKE